MKARPRWRLRFAWRQIPITLGVLAALLHLILLGGALRQTLAHQALTGTLENIHVNLSALEDLEENRLAQLRDEYARISAEAQEIEATFPKIGAPMAIYEQAFKHAPASELELLLVERKDKVSQETALGVLLQSSHRVDGLGTPASCMTFISTLEVLGLGSLAVDGIRIDAENGDCQFEVLTVGFE